MPLTADVQSLTPGALIELFVLDATAVGGTITYYHAGRNGLLANVVWQGQAYVPFPMQATGFEWTAQGALPKPKIQIANVNQQIGVLVHQYQDLVGAKIIRKRTLVKYLDAVNFPGGVNANADPTASFGDEIWFVDRKSAETRDIIEFELTAAWDVSGVQIPRRQFQANVCGWVYRSAECSYAGGAVAQADDTPTSNLALDRCGLRTTSCRLRFPAPATMPFGAFPGTSLLQ